jgi:AraC family transcriptional regulator
VPRFEVTSRIAAREVTSARVRCDGCDPLRPCDEHASRASLWILTAGAFELRDAAGRHAIDPTHAHVMPAGHAYAIRHPAGPDVCIEFRGPLVDRLAAGGARRIPVTTAATARLAIELAAWRRDEGDELALAETLATLAAAPPASADRDLAAAIAHVLRLSFADASSLTELADRTGYSVFHACRTFRATTGTTIHGFRRELRLRHALARIVGGDEPLARIAAATGFASQSHLTNLFRARAGVMPKRARTRDGMRALA